MNPQELYLKSLDELLSAAEENELNGQLAKDFQLTHFASHVNQVRSALLRTQGASFGPFFAERVTNYIRNLKSEIDYQIFAFFKKYQLVAVGIVVALVVLNIFAADQFTISSFLGFEETSSPLEEIDLYSFINP